jgi:nucleoside-diphosphate-sugar epimerase
VRVLTHASLLPFEGADQVRGDITRPEDIASACRDMDAVCHLATVKGDKKMFLPINLGGLHNILEYARESAVKPHIILLSGDNVLPIYDYPSQAPMNESHPYLFVDDNYGLSKILEEVMALLYFQKYGLKLTILRSSWIMEDKRILTLCDPSKYGMKKYLAPDLLLKLDQGARFRIVPAGRDGRPLRRSVVDPRDLARAFTCALTHPKAQGELFNIAGPCFSYRDLAEHLSKKDGLPVHNIDVQDAFSFEIAISKAKTIGFTPQYSAMDTADWALGGNT